MDWNGKTESKSAGTEKKLESNFAFLGQSSFLEDGESPSQYKDAYAFQTEELNLLRKKCQSLQMALDKCHDEQQSLQLQLLTERGQRDKAVKKVESTAEKTKIEFNGHLYSIKLDQERWKQQAESATREGQLLHEQLKVVQAQKSDAMQKLSKITEKYEELDGQRRLIDTYIKRQKNSAADLTRRLQQLESAKNDMSCIMEANREQINLFNVQIVAQQRQKSASDATIAELEKEIVQLNSRNCQLYSKNRELTEENEVMHLSVDDHMLKLESANNEIGQLKTQIIQLTADLQGAPCSSTEKKDKNSRRRI